MSEVILPPDIVATLRDYERRISQLEVSVGAGSGRISRAHRAAALAIAAGGYTKVPVDTATFNPNGDFDVATNHRYNVPIDGYYQVDAQVAVNGGAFIPAGMASVFKNGSEVSRGGRSIGTAVGQTQNEALSDIILCAAGDFLELNVYNSTANALALEVTGAPAENYLAVARVS